jgi:hypothetical protein
MAAQLSKEQTALIADRETLKLLATTDESGTPHVVVKQSIHLAEDGNIHYLELLESSRTNHNLVRAIWFDRKVSIAIKGAGKQSFQIKGRPVEVHVTGPLFEKHYVEVRSLLGDVDLAGVWVIEPEEVIDENPEIRRRDEEARRPFFRHLDRLAKNNITDN